MNKNLLVFLLCFAVAFGGGYLFYQAKTPKQDAPVTAQAENEQKATGGQADAAETTDATTAATATADNTSKEGEIFTKRGCVACHSVSALNVKGGAAGPDLSQAYVNVENKHGVPIEEFLKKPTSAVMSGVLGKSPLTDDERKAVLAALKLASEKK